MSVALRTTATAVTTALDNVTTTRHDVTADDHDVTVPKHDVTAPALDNEDCLVTGKGLVYYRFMYLCYILFSGLIHTDSKRCMRLMRAYVIPKISEEWEAVAAFLNYSIQAKNDIEKQYKYTVIILCVYYHIPSCCSYYAKQKHLGCKKVRGQSEATLQTDRCGLS